MTRLLLLILIYLSATGCVTTPVSNTDSAPIEAPKKISKKMTTEIQTGLIKSGHSGWISTNNFSEGADPEYYCANPKRHMTDGHSWMYELKDQENFLSKLTETLTSSGIYDANSYNKLVIMLLRAEQGPDDKPIYTFDIVVAYMEYDVIIYKKYHHLKGSEDPGTFLTSSNWSAAKERATSRLINVVIADLNTWLGQ